LPAALRLTEAWGFTYECVLTWVKNVGFTPYSWMYSTEHVIFARKGSLPLTVRGRRLDFAAKRREHSRKPNEFYALVRDVSPGPRLDLFSREPHDGFDQWGNETGKFTMPAEAAGA
jgi:N6-adenosine-specific RNA methylase IME4